jgi:xanthosine phosphorylase
MTETKSYAHQAAEYIKEHYPTINPKIGIVLGSGLGGFADALENKITIPYELLPGFPQLTVHGHESNMIIGQLNGVTVICLQGRSHLYEGSDANEHVKTYVRTLKLLGCSYFLATNAAGSLREDVGPGELMIISDHINFQANNPLAGPNDDEFGPRFFPLDNAYDVDVRQKLLTTAHKNDISIHQGVYISVLGPNYETAAEIKAFRILGADAVGMSTVPEVLVANHCGMKVGVISIITNYATGLASTSHNHDAVVMMASRAAEKLVQLLKAFIVELS